MMALYYAKYILQQVLWTLHTSITCPNTISVVPNILTTRLLDVFYYFIKNVYASGVSVKNSFDRSEY